MKRPATTFLVACTLSSLLCISSCESPAPAVLTEADKEYLQNTYVKIQESWNKGDRDPYADQFSKDAFYMPPNMETIIGQDAIREFARTYPDLKINFTVAEVLGSSECAIVRGIFIVTSGEGSQLDKGKFITIFQKSLENGEWLVTHDIFNSDLPVPVNREEPLTE